MRIEVGAAAAVDELQTRTEEPARRLISGSLTAAGLRAVLADVDRDEFPDPEGADVAVLLGSSRALPTDAPVGWIRRADQAGARILAIGHGASALALAFGASRQRLARPYEGWSFVRTEAPHLIPTGPWLTSQEDVINLAQEAVLLADNRLGPQAFRIGRHVGLRFDPVVNRASPGVFGAATPGTGGRAVQRDPAAAEASAQRLVAAFCADRL